MTSDLNVSPAAVVSFLTPSKSHPLMPSCCASSASAGPLQPTYQQADSLLQLFAVERVAAALGKV